MKAKERHDRWGRFREARRFFRQLWPGLSFLSYGRLEDMAVSYWESPSLLS